MVWKTCKYIILIKLFLCPCLFDWISSLEIKDCLDVDFHCQWHGLIFFRYYFQSSMKTYKILSRLKITQCIMKSKFSTMQKSASGTLEMLVKGIMFKTKACRFKILLLHTCVDSCVLTFSSRYISTHNYIKDQRLLISLHTCLSFQKCKYVTKLRNYSLSSRFSNHWSLNGLIISCESIRKVSYVTPLLFHRRIYVKDAQIRSKSF